jgi:hypothetical protein
MFIFSRQRTIDPGRVAEAMSGATGIAKMVGELTDLQVTPWYTQYAPTGPAVTFTVRLEHLEQFDAAFEVMMASSDYQDALAELDESFTGPVIDNMVQIVGGTPPKKATALVTAVQATAMPGHLRAAMHWGTDVAERVGRSLDVPTLFGRNLWGDYGGMMWASYYEDSNALEGVQAKFGADEMLQAVVDEGTHNCQPGAIAVVMRQLT